jgi:hypothetical protein
MGGFIVNKALLVLSVAPLRPCAAALAQNLHKTNLIALVSFALFAVPAFSPVLPYGYCNNSNNGC